MSVSIAPRAIQVCPHRFEHQQAIYVCQSRLCSLDEKESRGAVWRSHRSNWKVSSGKKPEVCVTSGGSALFDRADHGTQPHQLVILTANAEDWLEQLAERYRSLRTETRISPAPLSLDGVEVLDVESLKRRLGDSQIAARTGGNFDVLRSDLGEVILNYIGQELDQFDYGYQSIRDRELVAQPGRGIDQLGVKAEKDADGNTQVSLMLGEAKVSAEQKHPPGVVDSADDSLSKSHAKQLREVAETAGKIWTAYRFCVDQETQNLFGLAVLMFEEENPNLIVHATSVLVRPKDIGCEEDFGTYASNPEQFDGATVNFYVVRADGNDLEKIIDKFLELIQSEESEPEAEAEEEATPDDGSA